MTDEEFDGLKKNVIKLIKNKILRILYNSKSADNNFGLERYDRELYIEAINELEKDGLISRKDDKITLSHNGSIFAQQILTDIS